MLRITPIVKNLLIINIIIFVIPIFIRIDMTSLLALRYIESENFAPYQFFTYMFAHGSFTHLLFNMLALFFIGPLLENFWGPKRFLSFYIITGIGAAIIYSGIQFFEFNKLQNRVNDYVNNPTPEQFDMFVNKHAFRDYNRVSDFIDQYYENPDNQRLIEQSRQYVRSVYQNKINVPMVGASGAIYGLIMAIALLFPNVQFFLIFPPIPIKAKYMAIILAGISIYLGIQRNPNDMVAHFAHLGGMVFAFILIQIWRRQGSSY